MWHIKTPHVLAIFELSVRTTNITCLKLLVLIKARTRNKPREKIYSNELVFPTDVTPFLINFLINMIPAAAVVFEGGCQYQNQLLQKVLTRNLGSPMPKFSFHHNSFWGSRCDSN